MSIDWKRAVQAGIVGTVVFDLLGLVLTGRWGVPCSSAPSWAWV
jgi:hypothetical protein